MAKWKDKDKRQFSHVKQSELERGSSEDEAEEIAGRVVNKQRRTEGRTPNKTTQGTGNPNKKLEDRTIPEVRNLAKQQDVAGRSRMRKHELIQALDRH